VETVRCERRFLGKRTVTTYKRALALRYSLQQSPKRLLWKTFVGPSLNWCNLWRNRPAKWNQNSESANKQCH